jgi:hypothetical protein
VCLLLGSTPDVCYQNFTKPKLRKQKPFPSPWYRPHRHRYPATAATAAAAAPLPNFWVTAAADPTGGNVAEGARARGPIVSGGQSAQRLNR